MPREAYLERVWLWPASGTRLPVPSPRTCLRSGVTVRSWMHCAFLPGAPAVGKGSGFILLPVRSWPFPPTPSVEQTVFLPTAFSCLRGRRRMDAAAPVAFFLGLGFRAADPALARIPACFDDSSCVRKWQTSSSARPLPENLGSSGSSVARPAREDASLSFWRRRRNLARVLC